MERKYPVGIQTFSEIIRGGYVYVDKTDLMWRLQNSLKYVFLSRPRRFGKSLLTSTMESFFRGERELFEGLKIMSLEKDWKEYPVIRLDLSTIKNMSSADDLKNQLFRLLLPYEKLYGFGEYETTPGSRLSGIIYRAFHQKNAQVVVIIDEYDSVLLDVLHEEKLLDDYRRVMQEFYQVLKPADAMLRFCFLTGITRLSQMNIFSALNNLTNISLDSRYAAICGITDEELCTTLRADVALLALNYQCDEPTMHNMLKARYDGYHFSSDIMRDVYNPYSLLSAFEQRKLGNYWFDTGTPTFLIRQLKHFKFNISSVDHIETTDYAINRPTEALTTVEPLLYQTGYLTIKDYDRDTDIYTLSVPNQEVRIGLVDGLLPAYIGLDGEKVQAGFALRFWRALKAGDIEQALLEMKSYFAGLPYIEGFKQKLADVTKAEGFYEWTFYLVFSMLNVYVRTQVKTIHGRADIVVWMPDTIYVFEIKVNKTAQEALDQINNKGYAIPYQADGRNVVKVGVRFSTETLAVEDWIVKRTVLAL